MLLARAGRRCLALLLIAASAGAAGLAASPTAALAGTQYYCIGGGAGANLAPNGLPGNACYGDRHSLNSNRVFNTDGAGLIGAAALYDCLAGVCQYYNWITGNGYACHPYSGANLLYPWEANFTAFYQHVYGISYFGVDTWC